ncbi:hypothetical protein [Undibacterium terreum]|uniref:Uncharacterized protein n=1 Tax=Undibacterium terreum TaxID=1224302 RepID=A0A916UZI6_9BURK|nr:hypothetical protein [Undibacterium terreum]GGC95179.1 hypothetical protein GCM10011396_48170 [Undibacterium terreum]
MKHLFKFSVLASRRASALAFSVISMTVYAAPAATPPAPDLDLTIQYYSKIMTPEGVLRESRYEEKMLRRPSHVWVARVLPAVALAHQEGHDEHQPQAKRAGDKNVKQVSLKTESHEHKHFNHVVVPHHVILDNNKVRIEFVDAIEKQVVTIPAAEFENVNFDGSWVNAYYLLDPEQLKTLPLSTKLSTVPGARWRERETNGVYQRVLWDEKRQIPLVVETGDKAGSFYRRIDVKPLATVSKDLPWANVKGFAQKEYSDFLD